jgi:hypothetical protein
MSNAICPVCKQSVKTYTVFTHRKKWTQLNEVCIPCKAKEDKERLVKIGKVKEINKK